MLDKLQRLYNILLKHFGHLNWWPGDSPFEIVVGAILTQNTAWSNVEKAIKNLKNANLLNPESIGSVPTDELALLIRPSGYYNQKAKRLKTITLWFQHHVQNHTEELKAISTPKIRRNLLELHGVGPETADSILLYALERPAFVIDAYTRRIMSRIGYCSEKIGYSELQGLFEQNLPADTNLYNDFHAQFVMLGKEFCHPKPKCEACPVLEICEFGKSCGDNSTG